MASEFTHSELTKQYSDELGALLEELAENPDLVGDTPEEELLFLYARMILNATKSYIRTRYLLGQEEGESDAPQDT